MKLLSTLIIAIACLTTNAVNGQMRETSLLIIKSTTNYDSAIKKAELASNKLGFTLKLDNNCGNDEPKESYEEICDCGENGTYLSVGRYNQGQYVTVECSSGYDFLREGYYIVVVASGEREKMKSILAKVQVYYKDAYLKNTDIWVGCSL